MVALGVLFDTVVGTRLGERDGVGSCLYVVSRVFSNNAFVVVDSSAAGTSTTSVSRRSSSSSMSVICIPGRSRVSISLSACSFRIAPISKSNGLYRSSSLNVASLMCITLSLLGIQMQNILVELYLTR